MRSHVLCVAALFAMALLVAKPTRADDKKSEDKKYTVKAPKMLAKGKSVKVNEKTTSKESVKFGNLNMDKNRELLRVYVEKTLDVDEKANKRTKFSRTYEKAKLIENDESTSKSYQGRTVVAERSKDKWSVSAEGKEKLDAEDLKELREELTRTEMAQDAFYPTKSVAVGGKWTMDGKEVAKILDLPPLKVDADSVKGEGKLVKVYKKGDKEWGTLEYTVTFESKVLTFEKIKSELKVTIDQALDGSSQAVKGTSKIKLSGKGEVDFNCMKVAIDLTFESTTEAEATEVK